MKKWTITIGFVFLAFFALTLMMLPFSVLAGNGKLPRDAEGQKLTTFAPDGKKDAALTVNSVTVDMRNDTAWSQYAPGACSYRTMSTATKAGPKRTLPATTWNTRYVNASTPFINFTGCTSGELQRQ